MKIFSLSSGTPRTAWQAATLVFGLFSFSHLQAQPIADGFDGASLDSSTWMFGSTNGTGAATLSGSSVTIDSGTYSGSQRSVAVSTYTNTNPFRGPVTVELKGVAISSTSAAGKSVGYVVIGRQSADTGGVQTGAGLHGYLGDSNSTYNTGGGAIGLNIVRDNALGSYTIKVSDMGASHTGISYTLDAAPTNITWTIDNTTETFNYSFEVTGALITAIDGGTATGIGTSTGSASWGDIYARFTEEDLLVGEESISRVAFGAINGGTLDGGSTSAFSVDSIAVSAVPEPSTYAAFASVFIGGFVLLRRVHRNRA